MNLSRRFAIGLASCVFWFGIESFSIPSHPQGTAEPGSSTEEPVGSTKPYGIQTRIPWADSRILGSPEPPSPYAIRRVFPNLTFTNPVEVTFAPGSDRLFVAELAGKIYSFPNEPAWEKSDLFLDAAQQLSGAQQVYGLEFHPDFQTNHFVYICYVLRSGLPEGSRVSRFTVSQTDPPRVDVDSEVQLITWLSGGHNGGSLKFGPDGFLYISTGDAASPNPPDSLKTGQDNSDLLSAILRIDVNHPDPGRNYGVPADNPFVALADTKPEIWAYGFRNPWRMSFDRKSGDLWTGDVGWELWELVFRVERGGNYGWSIVEGPQSINPDLMRGPTPILPPVKAHPHSEAASVTGGFVYRGSRLKELVGAYIYGDWVTGKIWALRSEGNKLSSLTELVDTALQIICFGEDHSGELYVVDYAGGIYQLEQNSSETTHLAFPRQLSDTGLFASERDAVPTPGVIPFYINAEMWADHAHAERFVGLPGTSSIRTGAKDVWLYQSKNEWRYPANAVLAKTLSLEMESGTPGSSRRIETQVLHFDGLDWHAYSYRWNNAQNDATLVNPLGDEQVFEVKDAKAPDGLRRQTWRFHSRTECLRCHNPWMNYALGFTAFQLNSDVHYQANRPVGRGIGTGKPPSPGNKDRGVTDNQLRTFSHLGFFDKHLGAKARPQFKDPLDATADISERARSWLHTNCAHCHREGAGGAVVSHFDYDTPPEKMRAIGRVPSQGRLGLFGAHVITPGDPYSSTLYYRISTTGQGRMPRLGSRIVDEEGMKLVHDWIHQLPEELSEDQSKDLDASKLRTENTETLKKLLHSASGLDQNRDAVDRLLSTSNGALALLTAASLQGNAFTGPVAEKAATHSAFQVRDLFERFLPYDKRSKKLGANIRPAEILGIKGDIAKGRQMFFREGVQCSGCHRVEGEGTDLGPDLRQISAKYDRAQILDNVLYPSRVIEPNFMSYQIETEDDFSYSGFILSKNPDEVVLKNANAIEVRIPARAIRLMQAQTVSIMPELLLQDMTAQNVADLLEYLSSLR